MGLEKIYVVRHGFRSSWSVDPITGVYTGMPSPTGIAADPALTSHGVNQSKEMGRHLMTLEPPIEEVYSSPFYRCLQTMAPFMDLQQKRSQEKDAGNVTASSSSGVVVAKMLPEHGIREWFGSAPFDHPEPAAPEKLKSMFPSYDESYESTIVPSKKGETLDQLQQRITIALRGIIKRCDANGTRAIVLCSHAAVIILIGRILTGLVPPSVDAEDFYAYTCGLSVYCRGDAVSEASGRSSGRDAPGFVSNRPTIDTNSDLIGGWDCQLNSDCSFLSGGEERGWKISGDESFPGTGSLSQTEVESKL